MKIIILLLPILLFGLTAGDYVPGFELYELDSDTRIASNQIFKEDISVLIFWSTYCAECVEALMTVGEREAQFSEIGVTVTTININHSTEIRDAREIAKKIPYTVLYDDDQMVARQYDSHLDGYKAFVLTRDGRIMEILDKSDKQAGEILLNSATYYKNAVEEIAQLKTPFDPENMTEAQRQTQPQPQPSDDMHSSFRPSPSRFSMTGTAKIRYHNVKIGDMGADGVYGEPVEAGGHLDFLFTPDVRYRVSDKIVLGSVIRLTNITRAAMIGSPDYYTNDYFSPYIVYNPIRNLTVRAGFFREHFTPLTLMRWDEMDAPPVAGGSAGVCRVCAGLPGGVSSANLEELDYDLGFEGLSIKGSLGDHFDYSSFYARAQTAGGRCNLYDRNLLGIRLKASRKTNQYIAFNAIIQDEEPGFCTDPEIRFPKSDLRDQNIASFDARYNFLNHFTLFGEFAYSHSTDMFPDTTRDYRIISEDISYMAGARYSHQILPALEVKIDGAYIHSGEDYLASYRALSYIEDRKGYRIRAEAVIPKGGAVFFLRNLDFISDKPDTFETWSQPEEGRQIGMGFYAREDIFNIPVHFMFNYAREQFDTEYYDKNEELSSFTNMRNTITADLSFILTDQLSLQLQAQTILQKSLDFDTEEELEGSTDIISATIRLRF